MHLSRSILTSLAISLAAVTTSCELAPEPHQLIIPAATALMDFIPTNATSSDKEFFNAVYEGDATQVAELLEQGVSPDVEGANGGTALMFAAAEGHAECVSVLLNKGAAVNAKLPNGTTALIFAATYGHSVCARLLLEKGADASARISHNGQSASAADCAQYMGHPELARMLRDAMPLDEQLLDAAALGQQREVARLLNKGANPDARDKDDSITALIQAADKNHAGCVRLLLDKGANIDAKGPNGWTALMAAAYQGHVDIVRQLLERGANRSARNDEGMTARQIAAQNGHSAIVRLLQN